MKIRLIFSVLFITLVAPLAAQTPTALWGKAVQGMYQAQTTSQGCDIQLASDGGLYISAGVGTIAATDVVRFGNDEIAQPTTEYRGNGNSGNQNLIISKIAADGTPAWTVFSKHADIQSGKAMMRTVSDGLIVVVGLRHATQYFDTDIVLVDAKGKETGLNWTISNESGRYNIAIVMKLGSDGALQWVRRIDANHDVASIGIYPNALAVDSEGNIYVGGNQRVALSLLKADGTSVQIAPRHVDGWDGDAQKSVGDLFVLKLDKDGYYMDHLQSAGRAAYLIVYNMEHANGRLYLLGHMTGMEGEQATLGGKVLSPDNTNSGLLVAAVNTDLSVDWAQYYSSAKSNSIVNQSNLYVNSKNLWIACKSNLSLATSTGQSLTCEHTRDGMLLKADVTDGKLLDGYINQINQTGYFSTFEDTDGRLYALGHTLLQTLYVHQFNPDNLSQPVGAWDNVIANTSDAQGVALTNDGRMYLMTRSNNTSNALMGSATTIVQDAVGYCCNVSAFQLPVTPVTAIRTIRTDNFADGIYYNLGGQRVEHPTKGVYIRNGRKVIFK